MLEIITNVNNAVNGVVWGWPALILLAFVGVLMTCLTKFFQVSHFGHWVKMTIGAIFQDRDVVGHTKDKSISQFQPLCTALAATVGTGNIVGVAIFGGAVMGDNLAWDLADTFNGLMMIPNLIGVLVLSPLVYQITRNYVDRVLKGKNVKPMLSAFPDVQAEQEKNL